jgi:hypothetical protein
MGTYDEVSVPCPECGRPTLFQSKGGECSQRRFELFDVPDDVLANVNRHAPYQCEQCMTWFAVHEASRTALRTQTPPPNYSFINGWYQGGRAHDAP